MARAGRGPRRRLADQRAVEIQARRILSKGELRDATRIIELFRHLNTDQAEIVATLYACWNDILLEKSEVVNEEMVIREFLKHWHPAKSRFTRSRLARALAWMRSNKMVPSGKGRRTAERAIEQVAG